MTAAAFDIVRDVVTANRRAGSNANYAVQDAAHALGTSARWITSVLRNEPYAVKPGRAAELYARYRVWLTSEIARNEQIIARQRALLAGLEGNVHAAADTAACGADVAGVAAVDAKVKCIGAAA